MTFLFFTTRHPATREIFQTSERAGTLRQPRALIEMGPRDSRQARAGS